MRFGLDDERLITMMDHERVGVGDTYRLYLQGDCPNLTFRQSFDPKDRPGSAWIFSPLDATIVYRDTGITSAAR